MIVGRGQIDHPLKRGGDPFGRENDRDRQRQDQPFITIEAQNEAKPDRSKTNSGVDLGVTLCPKQVAQPGEGVAKRSGHAGRTHMRLAWLGDARLRWLAWRWRDHRLLSWQADLLHYHLFARAHRRLILRAALVIVAKQVQYPVNR